MVSLIVEHLRLYNLLRRKDLPEELLLMERLTQNVCENALNFLTPESLCKWWKYIVDRFTDEYLENRMKIESVVMFQIVSKAAGIITTQMDVLTKRNDELTNQINALQQRNNELMAENSKLTTVKDILDKNI